MEYEYANDTLFPIIGKLNSSVSSTNKFLKSPTADFILKNIKYVNSIIDNVEIKFESVSQINGNIKVEPHFANLMSGRYMPNNVASEISQLNTCFVISYKSINPLHISGYFTIYSPYNTNNNNNNNNNNKNNNNNINIKNNNKYFNYILVLAKEIVARILFFNTVLATNKIPNLCIFLTTQKKVMPKQNTVFAPEHINSAVTDGVSIVIYRHEEVLKSVLHELVHYYGLDFNPNTYPTHYIQQYLAGYNLTTTQDCQIRPSEAYTEMLANIINICMINSNSQKNIKKQLENEIRFTMFQASKIFKHLKYKSTRDFHVNTPNSSRNTKTKTKLNTLTLHQDSHVLSYYIIKSAMLCNIQKVFETMCDPGIPIKFVSNNRNYSHLDNMIIGNLSVNSKWSSDINNLLDIINNSDNWRKVPAFFKKTTRMTLHE